MLKRFNIWLPVILIFTTLIAMLLTLDNSSSIEVYAVDEAPEVTPDTIPDPNIPQLKLTADGGIPEDFFGFSTGIEGNTMVIAAPSLNDGAGAVYVFERVSENWTQQAALTAIPAVSGFGFTVAISGDTVAVTSPYEGRGAIYIFVRNGEGWVQQAKIIPPDLTFASDFGYSVALDGDTLVAGDYGVDAGKGGVYVYVRNGTTWSQEAKLRPSDAENGDFFGVSVALFTDTLVVGATGVGLDTGAAYVFTRSGTVWSQQAKLSLADTPQYILGSEVAIYEDTAFISAYPSEGNENGVFVFERNSTTWTQKALLTSPSPSPWRFFGRSIALQNDTAIIGASGHHYRALSAGAAYIYERDADTWTLKALLLSEDAAASDDLGLSVALDGNTFVAGAIGDESFTGAAYIFTRPTEWPPLPDLTPTATPNPEVTPDTTPHPDIEQLKLVPDNYDVEGLFGVSTALSGNTLVVGSSRMGFSSENVAYIFEKVGGNWVQQAKLLGETGTTDEYFGSLVAISEDTIAISSPYVNFSSVNAPGRASIYIFVRDGENWILQARLNPEDRNSSNTFAYSIALEADTLVVGEASTNQGKGAVYVFVRNGTTWTQEAKLELADAEEMDFLGTTVSLSGNTLVAGATGRDSNLGAAYIFTRDGTEWTLQAEVSLESNLGYRRIGSQVALSDNTLLVSADDTLANNDVVLVYSRANNVWSWETIITSPTPSHWWAFGQAIALQGDTAIIGAPGHHYRAVRSGAAYIFSREGDSWHLKSLLLANDANENNELGLSVALDGKTFVAGSGSYQYHGAVYVFTLPDDSHTPTETPTDEPSETATETVTETATETATVTETATETVTKTATETPSETATDEPTLQPGTVLVELPEFGAAVPIFSWLSASSLTEWYQIIVTDEHGTVIMNQWIQTVHLCQQSGQCLYTPQAYIPFGLDDGNYSVVVNTWNDEDNVGNGTIDFVSDATFTVSGRSPIDATTGRVILVLENNPNISWLQVWIGTSAPEYQTIHSAWYEIAKQATCTDTVCTLLTDAHPVNGDYVVYMQFWDGDLSLWGGPFKFELGFPVASLITSPSVSTASLPPTFTWEASTGATWYQIWVGQDGGSGSWPTMHLNWYSALDLGCSGSGTCTFTPDELSLNEGEYDWYVQAWGPGGFSIGGTDGWQSGPTFTIAP